mgnify:CR=1 FL=1
MAKEQYRLRRYSVPELRRVGVFIVGLPYVAYINQAPIVHSEIGPVCHIQTEIKKENEGKKKKEKKANTNKPN